MAKDNIEDIKSVDELRRAQAAAQAQGTSITNYTQWEQILEDFDTAGIQSTGSYDGDVKLHSEVMKQIEQFIEAAQEVQKQQEINPKNEETSKVDNQTSTDKEQILKANVVNGTSSTIMADYMKYYHMLR
jgi:predicted O-linked N-acetylglucosamine transferase (SPINDLY family)